MSFFSVQWVLRSLIYPDSWRAFLYFWLFCSWRALLIVQITAFSSISALLIISVIISWLSFLTDSFINHDIIFFCTILIFLLLCFRVFGERLTFILHVVLLLLESLRHLLYVCLFLKEGLPFPAFPSCLQSWDLLELQRLILTLTIQMGGGFQVLSCSSQM